MKQKRMSETQNQMIYILGRYRDDYVLRSVPARVQNVKTELDELLTMTKDPNANRRAKLFLNEMRKWLDKKPESVRISLVDLKKIMMLAGKYKSKDSAKVSISKSLKELRNKELIKVVVQNSQQEACLTKKGLKQYKFLLEKIQPYIDIHEICMEENVKTIV